MNHLAQKRQFLFLYFEECVKKHFCFLNDMSLSVDKSRMGSSIIYASDRVKIGIFYERISYEIYLTISIMRGISCSIDEVIQHDSKRKFLYATTENNIENAVLELKELMSTRSVLAFINAM